MVDPREVVEETALPKSESEVAPPQSAGASVTGAAVAAVEGVGAAIGRYRWVICALLFFATTINYVDRQVLGFLAPDLQRSIGWNEAEAGNAAVRADVKDLGLRVVRAARPVGPSTGPRGHQGRQRPLGFAHAAAVVRGR